MSNLAFCQALKDLVRTPHRMLFVLCFSREMKIVDSGRIMASTPFAPSFDARHAVTATTEVPHNSSLSHLAFIIPALACCVLFHPVSEMLQNETEKVT